MWSDLGRALNRFQTYYSISVAIATTILILLGETRIDVYLSIYILEYYICRALITSGSIGEGAKLLKLLDYIFFIVFIIIVSIRVLEILAPELIWWPP